MTISTKDGSSLPFMLKIRLSNCQGSGSEMRKVWSRLSLRRETSWYKATSSTIQTREATDLTLHLALGTQLWKPTVVLGAVPVKKVTEALWTIPIIIMEGAAEVSRKEKPAKVTIEGTVRATLLSVKWWDRAEWVWDMTTNHWKGALL